MSLESRSRRSRNSEPEWAEYDDETLLDMKIGDLGLKIEGTVLEDRIARLYDELEQRGLNFRPHCWLSDDWFSPDGIPGIAIPFYLAHPRLMRLERRQLLEVEGGTEEWCMRILRHEAGHAIDNAYRLHRRRQWRENFGRFTDPYPEFYQPKPYSKSYVVHLEPWYAQSHPAEDFAETFAVWLKPRSRWRSQYHDWPALKKLEYVDELMEEIRGQKPPVTSRRHIDSAREIRRTLREHYQERRSRYIIDVPSLYDRDLGKLFSSKPEFAKNRTAAGFLRRWRAELRRTVSLWTGEPQYVIDQVLAEMIDRCRELRLRLTRDEETSHREALVLITVQTMHYLHSGRHRVAL